MTHLISKEFVVFFPTSRDPRNIKPTSRRQLALEMLETRNVMSASSAFVGPQLLVDPTSYDSDTILVQFNPDAEASGNLNLHGAKILRSLEIVDGLYELQIPAGTSVQQALATFRADTRVNVAEANYRLMLERIPNDPSFGSLYGMNNTGQTGGLVDADIDAPEAWDISTGTRNTIVAVIDSGVDYTHPDLAANMWRNAGEVAGDGVDNDGNGYVDDMYGYDFANNDADPMDDNSHGTHVAGTIGAVGNNGIGVAGVNWNTRIMALKFLGADGSGSTAGAISALNYAVQMGAKVSNNSWGGGGFSSLLSTAISNARNAGHIFVAAAGNSASNNDVTANYPSNYTQDNIVAVAATDSRDVLASFSSYGATTVDIAAPGVGILSTLPGNRYGSYSGTSMATPHVAGAISVIWDQNPSLTYQQVIQKLYASVDKISALTGKVVTGGRLNLAKALGTTTPPPSNDVTGAKVLSSEALGLGSGSITGFRVKFSESIQPTSFTSSDIILTGPAGTILAANPVAVANTNNTEFTFTIPSSSTVGSYTLKVGPNILDIAGNQMNQDGDTINGESTQDQYNAAFSLTSTTTLVATNNTAKSILDLKTVTSTISVSSDFNITDLDIGVNIFHTYDSDLVITLKSPTGQVATLANRRGGSSDNFTSTWFNDEAATSISAGKAPFTGSFRPETALSVFDGKNAKGTWTLSISDKASKDVGYLSYWGLKISGTVIPSTATIRALGDQKPELQTKSVNGLSPAISPDSYVVSRIASSLAREAAFEDCGSTQNEFRTPEENHEELNTTPAFATASSIDELFTSSVGVDFYMASTNQAGSEDEEVFGEAVCDAAFSMA
ncbi:MAG: S8 family serine peptidase [Planctomycetia bacterium]